MTSPGRVVVVGSGPAGAIAALRLLEQGLAVTMLESGQKYPNGLIIRALGRNLFRKWAPNAEQYPFVVSGDPLTAWPNTLAPGGLSNFWTGAVPRFAPPDFDEGARLDERYRWPLTYDDLTAYYTRAEQLLGVVGEDRVIRQVGRTGSLTTVRQLPAGWRAVADSAERQGQGLMYSPIADGPRWLARRSGAAFNSYDSIIRRLARFPRFELRLGAHVQELTWNAALQRVDGVQYVDRASGAGQQLDAAAVILAAGPLASPKLLLQSVSPQFPNGLGNTHGLVGRYVHDHPKDWRVIELDRALPRLDQPLYLSRAPYAESEPLAAAQISIGPLEKWDRVLSLAGARTRRFGLVTFATMLPEADNTIRLHPTLRDQFGSPVLDLHLHYGEQVARTVADAHRRFGALLRTAGLKFSVEQPDDRLFPGNSAHYGGGARMHATPEFGVLNGWNRLHEVDNVAVVDASSFTTAVEKNPTLTIMALAARAADRLAHDLTSTRAAPAPDATPHALTPLR
jgi:choline dehydrogenase-like flavoprotein